MKRTLGAGMAMNIRSALAILLLAILAPLPAFAGTTMYFVHNDHLGTPVAVTDPNQAVVWEANKKPFGETTVTGTIHEHSRFPGQLFDEETKLSYNYFRDYDPSLGRYIQFDSRGAIPDFSDPQRKIAMQMGLSVPDGSVNGLNHLYGYAGQNPLMYTDKTGELTVQTVVIVVILYNGYRIYTKLNRQINCEKECAVKTKEQCDAGDTSGLNACKVKCTQDIWTTTTRKAPWPKRP